MHNDDRIKRDIIRHFLATLAYRTQKALRGAPDEFADFRAADFLRTPHDLLLHMSGVVGFARSLFDGREAWPHKKPTFREEILRFHDTIQDLSDHLRAGAELKETTPERLLQGPLSDAMTHAGQLSMLRRLFGSPVPGEGFMLADIDANNVGPDQPDPVRPDKEFLEPGFEGEFKPSE